MYPLVDVASGDNLVHPPGIFSYYRVFSTGKRYGNAARDWPTVTLVLPDGAVEARWAPAKAHPVAMTAVYRWTAADVLDLETSVTPDEEMPGFEVFVSSYFVPGFRASVYAQSPDDAQAKPGFIPADRTPQSKGGYVMFPRDREAEEMITDGRWKIPPNAVDWALIRWLAAPLVMRRDETRGLTGLMMIPPDDCFAVSCPWNRESREQGGYRSLYFSLFGRDVKAGQTVRAHTRLVIRRNLSDAKAVELYQQYLKERQP